MRVWFLLHRNEIPLIKRREAIFYLTFIRSFNKHAHYAPLGARCHAGRKEEGSEQKQHGPHFSGACLLNISGTDFLSQVTLCLGDCPVYRGVFRSILVLYPLDASSNYDNHKCGQALLNVLAGVGWTESPPVENRWPKRKTDKTVAKERHE